MELLAILVLVILLAFAALVVRARKRRGNAPEYSYAATGALLTQGELAFHKILTTITPRGACLNAKVRLADILKVDASLDKSRRVGAFAKIQSKHIDFVLCDAQSMKILCAIELHDKSHLAETRAKRDDFVRRAFATANVPYLEVKASRFYNPKELRECLDNVLRPDPVN